MILIVDDDEIYAIGLRDLLKSQGYHDIEIALNGTTGLAAILGTQPDLIILDIMMPYGSNDALAIDNPNGFTTGLALLEQMVLQDISLDNVVVISVKWAEEFHDQLRDLGVKNILTKPADASDILNCIAQLMDG